MAGTLRLDGKEYDVSLLSEQGRQHLIAYQHASRQIAETENMMALLTKARNAYIADLKNEMIQGKTGIDLGSLFDD